MITCTVGFLNWHCGCKRLALIRGKWFQQNYDKIVNGLDILAKLYTFGTYCVITKQHFSNIWQ